MLIEKGVLIVILLIAAITDIYHRRIPNKLILSGIAISLTIGAYRGLELLLVRGIAAIVVFLILFVIYICNPNIFPGGDIKLVVFIMVTLGPVLFFEMVRYIAVCSIPVIIYYLIKKDSIVPYAVPMFLASIVMWGNFL